MKTITISSWVLWALIGLIAYQLYLGRQSLKGARQLSNTLTHQLDTLQQVYHQLVLLHQEYEGLYQEFHVSKVQLVALQGQLKELASENIASVSQLQSELHLLLTKYDTLRLPLPISSTTDDLSFQP